MWKVTKYELNILRRLAMALYKSEGGLKGPPPVIELRVDVLNYVGPRRLPLNILGEDQEWKWDWKLYGSRNSFRFKLTFGGEHTMQWWCVIDVGLVLYYHLRKVKIRQKYYRNPQMVVKFMLKCFFFLQMLLSNLMTGDSIVCVVLSLNLTRLGQRTC